MTLIRNRQPRRLDLLCGVFSSLYKNMHYLCKLLACSHQICTAGASDVLAPADRFTPGLHWHAMLCLWLFFRWHCYDFLTWQQYVINIACKRGCDQEQCWGRQGLEHASSLLSVCMCTLSQQRYQFGRYSKYHHTIDLCPLTKVEGGLQL